MTAKMAFLGVVAPWPCPGSFRAVMALYEALGAAYDAH